jgi:hypothetical protein
MSTFAEGQALKFKGQAQNSDYLQRKKKVVLEERGEAMVAQRCDAGPQLGIQSVTGRGLRKERVCEVAKVGPVVKDVCDRIFRE